ncbi:MAG: PEGA domain-containing protein [Vicinamibacterales bacterium]
MLRKTLAVVLVAAATLWAGPLVPSADGQQRRPPAGDQRRPTAEARRPPARHEVPPRYLAVPRRYFFPPVDARLSFYYHPYFGFYYGPYYGPFYPYPGPFAVPPRFSDGALRIQVKPEQAEVYLNGYYAGLVDDFDGVFQRLYVPAGPHDVEIRLEGYETYHRKVYVTRGDTFDIKYDLRRLPPGAPQEPMPEPAPLPEEWLEPLPSGVDQPASPYGVLVIHVQPADASVVIDGEAWPAPQAELVVHLPAGRHHIEVTRAGMQPFRTDVDLAESRTERLNVKLSS